jgi:hypothetical protein
VLVISPQNGEVAEKVDACFKLEKTCSELEGKLKVLLTFMQCDRLSLNFEMSRDYRLRMLNLIEYSVKCRR